MKKENEIRITVRFPANLIEQLRPISDQNGRSLNSEIVQAIKDHVKKSQKSQQK